MLASLVNEPDRHGFKVGPVQLRAKRLKQASPGKRPRSVGIPRLTHTAASFSSFDVALVLRKASRFVVILALLASIGGHWALLQSVAWTRMLIERTHTDSFAAAVQTTLDGAHPCDMCKRITEGKQSEEQSEKLQVKLKVDMLCELRLIAIIPPSQPMIFQSGPTEGTPRAERPPVPPPRAA